MKKLIILISIMLLMLAGCAKGGLKEKEVLEFLVNKQFESASENIMKIKDINKIEQDINEILVVHLNDGFFDADYDLILNVDAISKISNINTNDWKQDILNKSNWVHRSTRGTYELADATGCLISNLNGFQDFSNNMNTSLQYLLDFYDYNDVSDRDNAHYYSTISSDFQFETCYFIDTHEEANESILIINKAMSEALIEKSPSEAEFKVSKILLELEAMSKSFGKEADGVDELVDDFNKIREIFEDNAQATNMLRKKHFEK